jgi:hypothetical protein
MGLDMYITGKRFLRSYPKDGPDRLIAKQIAVMFPNIGDAKMNEVSAKFACWRKANAIHNWFVENVQNGEDECEEYYLEKEMLEKLLATVNEVLEDNSKAEALLPTTSGFFFGDTSYGELYLEGLRYTKEKIGFIVDNWENLSEEWDFYYQASW